MLAWPSRALCRAAIGELVERANIAREAAVNVAVSAGNWKYSESMKLPEKIGKCQISSRKLSARNRTRP